MSRGYVARLAEGQLRDGAVSLGGADTGSSADGPRAPQGHPGGS